MFSIAAAACCLLHYGCANNKDKAKPPVYLHHFHADWETLTDTSDEHRRRLAAIREHDRKALVGDLDLLFMADRPTRLTRWHDE
jgi:hypothetical protein